MDFQRVVSVDNMRKSDAHTISHHTSSKELMMGAAKGIFDSVRFTGKVAIVCGKGNNAGDGYALASILIKNGITPTIFRAGNGFSEDGLFYYKSAISLGADEQPLSLANGFMGFDIVVDCLLGTGFSGGEVKGEIRKAIEEINSTNAFVVSADINSGLNGDTGVAEIAVNSDLTVSIGAYKTGLFLNDAPYYIDSMVNADIGIHIIDEEYKLIDFSLLHMFEGYEAVVMSFEEFYEKYELSRKDCKIAEILSDLSAAERKTYVVKSPHSAVVADLKYTYFCADYARV